MTNKFWIVVSEARGPAAAPARHVTAEIAFMEAERLASTCSGKFFVMEAVGASAKRDVVTVKFGNEDSIAF
jgi:hypothetical protein